MTTAADFSAHPLISVVMSVYNAEPYVAEAIASILGQTYSNFEFIVVDGGSTDGSDAIVREFAARDDRIRPVFLPTCGLSHALNVGLALVRGEWVAYMEADNVALPERFAVQLDWMRQTGVEIGGSLAKIFGGEDRPFWFPETHEAIQHELLFNCAMLQTTMLMRADIAKEHPFDEEAIFQDYEMWTRLAPHYRMGTQQQVLVKYRRHPGQTSIVKAARISEDQQRYRRRYFHTLFPDATEDDYAALDRVIKKEPSPDLSELKRSGEWLARLAQTPDNYLRQRMANRWQAACRRSARLGLACYRLYRQVAPQFGVISDERTYKKLRILCVLQLSSDSRLYAALASVKRRLANPGAVLRGEKRLWKPG
jgi:glycosyltransferase involved in cell wall biosynthesis